MKHPASIIAALSVTAALNIAAPAQAQAQAPSAAGQADIGKQIATAGAAGVAACASCHGQRGEGMAASNFPRIAGQPHAYLARQLTSYANGNRANPVMTPIAKALTPEQIAAVSVYYAALEAPSMPAAAKFPKRGQILANIGDENIGVQGCANCHGPGGIGQPPLYPYLASQYMGYLVTALGEWKSGARKTDPSKQMNIIAQRLSDADIQAVSAYYAAQPAPPPEPKRMNVPAGSAARPVAPPAGAPGTKPSVPTQGIGTEQGAPTTGGVQGPGGGGGASGGGPQGSPR